MSVRKSGKIIAGTPRTTGGVEIGDMGFAPLGIDESLNLRRYMNGQVISQTQFVSFTNKVKAAIALYPNLATTETNWQAEKTNSKLGQCGKFVVDDAAGTIRLPAVVNPQGLLGLSGIGNLVNESLPNITGSLAFRGGTIESATAYEGAFAPVAATDRTKENVAFTGSGSTYTGGFDASRSSSTYQDNAPVQQEAVQYPYYIQVATGVEETLPAIREYTVNNSDYFGKSMYSDIAPDNASWLASNGSYNSRAVYPDYYDWLNGKIGQVVTANGGKVVLSTDTYTDYDFVVNQNDQTFRLPLLNGEEDLPSDRYDNLTISATTQRFTAPANGIYTVSGIGFGFVDIANETSGDFGSCSQPRTTDGYGRYTINAKQGDKIVIFCTTIPSSYICRFIYAKGNGSLYYYVGDTVQDASLINAGAVLGQLATKTNSVEAAAASMPSSRYIDLTLGASGTEYTAPANGYFDLRKSGSSGQYIKMTGKLEACIDSTGGILSAFFPVIKGDKCLILYTASGTTHIFRFVYAEGEN